MSWRFRGCSCSWMLRSSWRRSSIPSDMPAGCRVLCMITAEGYLIESQRHGRAGYNLTKLLARLDNSIRLINSRFMYCRSAWHLCGFAQWRVAACIPLRTRAW